MRNDYAPEAVLDKLNRGIVIFDPDARVHFLNDAAMRLIRESKAIEVIDSRLVFTEAGCQDRFTGYLRRCAERASSGSTWAKLPIAITTKTATIPFHNRHAAAVAKIRHPVEPAIGSRKANVVPGLFVTLSSVGTLGKLF